ncbi:hypothetical protein [Methylophaga sp.]|jgi:hypothetical protein|uniref:hypothetical protein n=1 Tax=Methylophaga sp. TaxID=2024840 RepID=UPI00140099F6|nr:hypothetical protein [Methylophaga sp.]MTI64602.1 hypothetical protein [Methylophaga sp.]
MNDWLYFLLVPALLLLIWFWPEPKSSRSPLRRSSDNTANSPAQTRFHAVSIEPGSHPCDAAIALRGRRFLAHEAMSLPVEGCDASRCQCTYKHYADRRRGEERRRASVAMREHFSHYEQRHGGDRRKRHAYT